MSHRYAFFAETYATERLKTLSVWSQMVHQCLSEDRLFSSCRLAGGAESRSGVGLHTPSAFAAFM